MVYERTEPVTDAIHRIAAIAIFSTLPLVDALDTTLYGPIFVRFLAAVCVVNKG